MHRIIQNKTTYHVVMLWTQVKLQTFVFTTAHGMCGAFYTQMNTKMSSL